MVEHYGDWSFDTPKFLILNVALGGAYPAKTNGVKSPYPGIPEPTVQLIKDNQVKMLVDWVRVSKFTPDDTADHEARSDVRKPTAATTSGANRPK